MTYLSCYNIEGARNSDPHRCFANPNTYPNFQEDLCKFKNHLIDLVNNNESKTFYKFGDGDYRFLKRQPIGSAMPGIRAISKSYEEIDHSLFIKRASLNDYYTCEIYPENRNMFREVIKRDIDYPAEYGYGLVSNKWLFKKFKGQIGLIGAKEKIDLIKNLMEREEYQNYLGLGQFEDYINFPQKFAADDLDILEEIVKPQLEKSTAKIFLLGIGHAKNGILNKFKSYKSAIYLDIGGGIDMLSGCISTNRPYAAGWTNYRLNNYDYSNIDYMNYNHANEKHI
jgi:hypothetical protein